MHVAALEGFAYGLASAFVIVGLGLVVERQWPVRAAADEPYGFNLLCAVASGLIQAVAAPLTALATVAMINVAGGGLIALPRTGWRLWTSLAIYLLVADLFEYLFHRAQHRIPWLWAMHSLHHSDPAMNVSTTLRHYWAEPIIKSLTIYFALGLIFKLNSTIIAAYASISIYNYFSHMNIPVSFGRWSWALNSPAFHRIHHAAAPKHWDRNFAGLLPIFDVLFGTYTPPTSGLWPETGLDAPAPRGLPTVLLWPFRRASEPLRH